MSLKVNKKLIETCHCHLYSASIQLHCFIVILQFYFDFPSKLLRNDNARPLTREDFLIYGNKPLSFIYDFKSCKFECE